MTSVEFITRLAPSIVESGQDYTGLMSVDQLALLDAMNDAIRQWFMAAPARLSRGPVNITLPAPQTVTLQLTNGSRNVQTSAFTTLQRGCSLLIEGDDVWNEVKDTAELASTYSGTTGTHDAVLHGDAYAFYDLGVMQLLSHPVCLDTQRPLVLDETIWRNDIQYRRQERTTWSNWLLYGVGTGDPTHYNVTNGIASRGSAVVDVLHVFPRPSRPVRLLFEALHAPCRMPMTALNTPQTLPVPDHHCTTELLPIARALLVGHPKFQGSAAATLAAGGAALRDAAAVATQHHTPNNKVRTRRGF